MEPPRSQQSTPSAWGGDQVRVEGQVRIISAKQSKTWQARRAASRGNRDHPGTAVQWDDALWEVIDIDRSPDRYEYRLERWEPEHAIRRIESYDEASEAQRGAARVDSKRREARRRQLTLLSFLTGHLPADIQEELHLEYGTDRVAPTIISAAPLFVIGTVSMIFLNAGAFGAPIGVPRWLMAIGSYFFAESFIRAMMAMKTGQPLGSVIGVIAYEFWRHRNPGKAPAVRSRQLATSVALDVDQSQLDRDRIRLIEPFLTLLPASDQLAIEQRYSIELATTGKRVAIFLLVVVLITIFGQVNAMSSGPATAVRILILLLNVYLVIEQIVRITVYGKGEIRGSLLGWLLRPFLGRLLH